MKKCFFFLLLLIQLIYSCDDTNSSGSSTNAKPKAYSEMVNEHLDTSKTVEPSFLKFVHRSSKKQTQKHIDSLIKAGKLQDESFIEFAVLNARFTGYPYNLQIDQNNAYKTILECSYLNDSLYTINLMPYGEYEVNNIIKFLKEQYGTPVFTSEEGYNDTIYYWLKNNVEISYQASALGVISFTDLELKKEDLRQRNELKKLKDDLDKEASVETKKDFQ